MLRALTLANRQELTMMEALGTLRNRLVHNVQQTNFTFDEYFKDPKKLEKFQNNFVIGEDAEQYRLTAEAFPRQAIWTCIVLVASRSLEAPFVDAGVRDGVRVGGRDGEYDRLFIRQWEFRARWWVGSACSVASSSSS